MSDDAIRVLHLTPQLSRLGGGVCAYLWDLVNFTAECGVVSYVAGTRDEFTERDIAPNRAAHVFAASARGNPAGGFSAELTRYLRDSAPAVDLIHSHGLRSGTGLAALRHARRMRLPLIVTPHGMLYPQLLQRARAKKWLIERLWDRNYRTAAACLHTTSPDEARIVRSHHADKPIAVVPIGLDTARFSVERSDWLARKYPALAGKKRALFLGIMDRKKGLPRLTEAWRLVSPEFPDWRLLIAGPDLGGHEQEVRQAVAHAGVESTVHFLGGVYGDDKARLYAESDLFVLPTEWENFGIAIAEALASGIPVITTRGAPWGEIESQRCGWWIENNVEALVGAVRAGMSVSDEERRTMGARGRELVRQKCTWPTIAAQMRQLYEWVLGRGARPAFVQLPP